MDARSMEEFRGRLAEAGWRAFRAEAGSGFGSWSIELEWGWRVEYNGKTSASSFSGKRAGTTGEMSGPPPTERIGLLRRSSMPYEA